VISSKAGASFITFHPEAKLSIIDRSLQLIREGVPKAGLVFNPATSLEASSTVMDKVPTWVLLMSVQHLASAEQKFIPGTLDKLREARALIMPAAAIFAWKVRRRRQRAEYPPDCRSRC